MIRELGQFARLIKVKIKGGGTYDEEVGSAAMAAMSYLFA